LKKLSEDKTELAKKFEAPDVPRILRELSKNEAFYFFTSIGNYTGECATSLEDFIKKIKTVSVKSIEFHLYREDFEKWVAETLEDRDLVQEIENLRKQNTTEEFLREKLSVIVSKRYEQLRRML